MASILWNASTFWFAPIVQGLDQHQLGYEHRHGEALSNPVEQHQGLLINLWIEKEEEERVRVDQLNNFEKIMRFLTLKVQPTCWWIIVAVSFHWQTSKGENFRMVSPCWLRNINCFLEEKKKISNLYECLLGWWNSIRREKKNIL